MKIFQTLLPLKFLKTMSNLISELIPYATLATHVLTGALLLSVLAGGSGRRKVIRFVGENALLLAFVTALSATLGSLFYSEVIGYEPCVLCWWIRVFTFPLVAIFGLALYKKGRSSTDAAFAFATPLVILGFLVGFYFTYTTFGGASLLPCTAEGGACSKLFVNKFGYVTIPSMALTTSVILLLISWVKKIYEKT